MDFFKDMFGPNTDWKIYVPEKNIYIMKDHSWAFAAWEIERSKGSINSESVLFHFDYHLDDVADGLFVEGVMEAGSKDELFKLIRTRNELNQGILDKRKIQIDDFIWPSVARGTIETIFTIAPQNQPDFASYMLETKKTDYERHDVEIDKQDILKYIPLDKFAKSYRSYSLDEFKKEHSDVFRDAIKNNTKILDIDLDYFNPSQDLFSPKLMPEHEIRSILNELLNMCSWDLITVALSPIYCGGNEQAEYLLKIFLEVAEVER